MCEKSIVVGEQPYFSETHAEVVQGSLPQCLYEMDQKKKKDNANNCLCNRFFFLN